jgi:tRNA(fMet)-specific endonuclease VapC
MTLPLASSATLLKANLERLNALGDLLDIRPFDKEAAVYYGDVRSELEKKGETIGSNDLLIAAHALSLGWTLVTNNEREFSRVKGLKTENWAEE